MIAAAAAMVLVSCKETKTPENQPTVNVAADPATIEVGKTGNINLTLTEDAAKDITVTLAASSDAITLGETSTKIAKGSKTATVTFEAKKAGDVNVSVSSSDAKAGNPAAIKVTETGGNTPDPNGWKEYCEVGYAESGSWGSLGWVKMGDTTIEGGESGNEYFLGEKVPLNSSLVVLFQPYGMSDPTGATDPFTIIVYADWKNTGTLTKIANQDFQAGSAASEKSFTLEIPADAAEKGTIRVISSYTDGNWEMDDNGCGSIESGAIFDIQFVNAK